MTSQKRAGALAARAGPGSSPSLAAEAGTPAWRRHQEILGNAGTLIATTGASSLLGFAFWAVAARLFSQEAIGFGSATTSAITLLGEIGMFGLGTLLVTELPRRAPRANLVAAALLAASLVSLVVGLTFVLVAPHVSSTLRQSSGTLLGAAVLIVGVVLTAATFVFDQATIGLLRGGLQLTRNIVFSAAKLLLLPLGAYLLRNQFGTGIALCWVAGTAISFIPVAIWLKWKGTRIFAQPDWHVLRSMGRTVAAYNWYNIAATAPVLITPILVTVVVSPSANGAFYTAWMMASMFYLVPSNLATVLVAVAANDPQALARKLRFTLLVSVLIGVPGMAVLGIGGHFVLSIFGPSYAHEAKLPLALLAIAYLPMIPRSHYSTICRARGKVPRAAAVLTASAVLELTAVVVGAKWAGLAGLSAALVAVRFLTGAAVTPAVVRAAAGRGRHRHVAPASDAVDPARLWQAMSATETSQAAALAVLLLMSEPE